MQGRPTVSSPLYSSLCSPVLQSFYAVCASLCSLPSLALVDSLAPISRSAVPSHRSVSKAQIPLAQHLAAVKSHYLHQGVQEMSPTPMEKTLPRSAFCPRAWQVGVHAEVGITPAEIRKTKRHTHIIEAKLHTMDIINNILYFVLTFSQCCM